MSTCAFRFSFCIDRECGILRYYKNQPILIYTENDLDTYEWAKSQPDVTAFYEKNSTPRGIGGGVNFYG